MDQNQKDLLEQAGIDLAEAAGRFMNNEGLMLKFLLRFPQDPNYAQLTQALEAGDSTAAFTAAHTLKGVAGNLSMKALFAQASAMSETLRAGDLETARGQLPALDQTYHRVLDALAAAAR